MHISQQIEANIKAQNVADTITLDYEARFLRRKRLVSDSGEAFLVELPETRSLSATDGFVLDDGRIIAIHPKPEPIMKVMGANLARIAWHIGNRHTPCQIKTDYLLIQQDHVVEHMLRLLGAQIEKLDAPFTPEGGAYGHGRTHSHEHNHQHNHEHSHEHSHEPSHEYSDETSKSELLIKHAHDN
jgi:urease accessory protein